MSPRYTNATLMRKSHFGDLYRATDAETDQQVVLRRLFDAETVAVDPEQVPTLERRVERLVTLQHDNVTPVVGSGCDDEGGFVVSEWVEGSPLTAIVSDAALTVDDFTNLARQTLGGLEAIHAHGLVHGSLNPGRIVIKWMPDQSARFMITDLGLAELLGSADLVTADPSGRYTGVLDCLAPELFDGQPGGVSPDLYALGNIYYYALTQKLPFAGDSAGATITHHRSGDAAPVSERRQDLPQGLADWVMSLIARAPEDRPNSVTTARQVFESLLGGAAPEPPAAAIPAQEETPAPSQEAAPAAEEIENDDAPDAQTIEDEAAVVETAAAGAAPAVPKTAKVAVRAEPAAAKSNRRLPAWLPATLVGVAAVGLGVFGYLKFLKPDAGDTGNGASAAAAASASGPTGNGTLPGTPAVAAPLPTAGGASDTGASPALVDPDTPPVSEGLLAQFTFGRHEGGLVTETGNVVEWPKQSGIDAIGSMRATNTDPATGSVARLVVSTPSVFPALNGNHKLLQLTGNSVMEIEWQRSPEKFKTGDQLSWVAVLWSPEKNAELVRLHPPIKEEAVIETRITDGKISSRISHFDRNFPLIDYPLGNQMLGLSLVWTGSQDNARHYIVNPAGDGFASDLSLAPNLSLLISSIHLGGATGPLNNDLPSGIYFAELLLYDHALTGEELTEIGRYLATKYFR